MTNLVTRASKGSALTHAQMDAQIIKAAQAKVGAYTVAEGDNRDAIECSGTFAVTLPDATAIVAAADTGDFEVIIINTGSGLITLERTTGADTIDGIAADITLDPNKSIILKVNQAGDGYNALAIKSIGRNSIFIPAHTMHALATGGAGTSQINGVFDRFAFAFAAGTDQSIEFFYTFPKRWNKGTVTAKFHYGNLIANNDVVWEIKAIAVSDGDDISGAASYGTAITLTDTVTATANEMQITAETSVITIGGTPANNDFCVFRVSRLGADVGDTHTLQVDLMGVEIFYTTNAVDDR